MQPLAAVSALILAASALAGCASSSVEVAALRQQQPAAPADQAAVWSPQDRLYRSITVDYIGAPPSRRYRQALEASLDRAGLLAPAPAAARYALQITFQNTHNRHSTIADYRILDRAKARIVFDKPVGASFDTLYGAADWTPDNAGVPGARRGALSRDGYVTGYGQTDAQLTAQSITLFVIQLSQAEHVTIAAVVPCLDNAEVLALKGSLTARGVPWRTDNCQAYRQRKSDDGLRFTSYP
jgi:hypothetical protein